jgi:uncharacterized protein YjbI with pentapeptide repeats
LVIPSSRWLRRIGIAIIVLAALAAPVVFLAAMPAEWTATLTATIAKVIASLSLPLVIAVAVEAAVVLVAAIWWVWWRLPRRQIERLALKIRDPKDRADTEDSFRKTAGQALGGAAVLIGAAAAYLQFTQQQQASRDLLISNQVSKGFEQLAGEKMEMRLGGIYALEGVMNTSNQYHQPVLEALCAFVRESTTRQKGPVAILVDALFSAPQDGAAASAHNKPPNDIQAALTVIGRRKQRDPGDVNLTGAVIPGTDLNGANLNGADLSRAELTDAKLTSANLSDAYMSNVNLSEATLTEADLSGAHLYMANLSGGATLFGANLKGAELSGAVLFRANLIRANLSDASLHHADLSGAHLRDADLSRADLTSANLSGTDLTQTQLDKACGKPATLPPDLTLEKPCQPVPPK